MLHLRKLEPEDLDLLMQWENDAEQWPEGLTHNPLSRQDLVDYITSTTGDIYRDGQLRLIIEHERKAVGAADLTDFDPRNRRAAIGLYIAPESRGKGLSTKALEELEDYAFGFLHLRCLFAIISTHNLACTQLFHHHQYESTCAIANWTLEGDAVLFWKNA